MNPSVAVLSSRYGVDARTLVFMSGDAVVLSGDAVVRGRSRDVVVLSLTGDSVLLGFSGDTEVLGFGRELVRPLSGWEVVLRSSSLVGFSPLPLVVTTTREVVRTLVPSSEGFLGVF